MTSSGAEGKKAWVTLATNDSYAIGALVLAHSLIDVQTRFPLAVLVSEQVSEAMRNRLAEVCSEVHDVNILDSKDSAHLALLARPELGVTFTKLHCWALTHLEKAVFLDADTLVMRNCDELFEREELSAAPDAGWPDCFNSGVFVYKPSLETYNDLLHFAVTHGSFDGGDQGLLNAYFSDWATKDISKHLPFAYNMTATAVYSYLPAHKRYGTNVRIAHLIGYPKPWQVADLASYTSGAAAPSEYVQRWWNLFLGKVKPALSTDMEGTQLATCPAMVQAAPPLPTPPPPPSEVLGEAVVEADSGASYEPHPPPEYQQQTPPPAPPPPPVEVPAPTPIAEELKVIHFYSEHSPWYGDYRQTGILITYPEPEGKLPTPPPSPVLCQYTEITSATADVASATTLGEQAVGLETTPTTLNELLTAEEVETASPELGLENLLLTSTSPVLQQTGTNTQAEARETDRGIAAMMEKLDLMPAETSAPTEEPIQVEGQQLDEERRRHREAWERGDIDYAGRDSFENIMARMKYTMNRVNSKPVV